MTEDRRMTLTAEEQDFLYLIACSLNQETPEKAEDMDLLFICRMAHFHMVQSIICIALESTGVYENLNIFSEEIRFALKSLKDSKERSLKNLLLMDVERKRIFDLMDEFEIWHMPLKGVIVGKLYPKREMRQMSDNDILFDPDGRERVKELMMKRGYEVKSYDNGNHDVYLKPPIYNYEMHVSLFGSSHEESWYNYYKNIDSKLLQTKKFEREFSINDAYIYLITHAYKHHSGSGTGIRTLTDVYIYNKVNNDSMDHLYIKGECRKIDIEGYENQCRMIAEKVFGVNRSRKIVVSAEEELFLIRYLRSGTYGTLQQMIENSLNKISGGKEINTKTKIKYVIRRAYPGNQWFKNNYKKCEKYPMLIPIYAVKRIVSRPVVNRRIWKEIKSVFRH